MVRLALLLAARERRTPEECSAALAACASRVQPLARFKRLELRFGCQLPDDPLAAAAERMGRVMTPVSALLQLTGPSSVGAATLVEVVDGAGRDLHDAFDLESSAAALGTVRQITTGPTGPTVLVVGTRKLAALSEWQFHAYWAETHAPLALNMMPPGAAQKIGYEQLHASLDDSRRAADAVGLGIGDLAGVLQVFCRDASDFLGVAAEPSFAAAIYEDEKNFADQTVMRGGFVSLLDPAAR